MEGEMIELESSTGDLRELVAQLDAGWHIEAPLLQRTMLHGAAGGHAVLEAILARNGVHRFIALVDDPDVRWFLDERHLAILPV